MSAVDDTFKANMASVGLTDRDYENAPHGDDCPDRFSWRDDATLPCTCWKADAL